MSTYVITASVFVDNVDSPEEATRAVTAANDVLQRTGSGVEVILPDPDEGSEWFGYK